MKMVRFSSLLLFILASTTLSTAEEFEPMFIEAPKASYEDTLRAAAMVNEYDFDEAGEILGFPVESLEMGGFIGKSQHGVGIFKGIKYATAERFGLPTMVDKPDDIEVMANKPGPSCPQPSEEFYAESHSYSEDCLYLDVYVPLRRTVVVGEAVQYEYSSSGSGSGDEDDTVWEIKDRTSFYHDIPIVISIQGEDFTYFESRQVDGRLLAKYGSVIVVIVNYRTGVLGFLSSGDGRIKGNYGLDDQKVAIEWVKKYAKNFGGDPNSITLLGYSSGAESVVALMHNPSNTKHLFQRVVLQSGVAKQGTIFYNNKDAERSVNEYILKEISEMALCDGDVVECLKNLDTMELVNAAGTLAYERKDNRTFGPVYDDKVFSCADLDLSQFEIMIGFVENEAGNWVGGVSENVTVYDVIKHLFASNSYFHCAPEHLVNFLDFEYRQHSEVDAFQAVQRGFVKLVSDFNFIAPAISFANKVAMAGAKTYLYEFSAYVPTMGSGKPVFLEGTPIHGEDQHFLFGLPILLVDLFRSSSRNVSANYIRMLTNFAHSGDPDAGPTEKPVAIESWKPYSSTYMGTYVISEQMEMKYQYFARKMAVWTEAVTYLMSDDLCKVAEQEPTPTCNSKSCRYANWEKSYQKWRDVDLPQWREKFQQVSEVMDDQASCEGD